MKKRIVAGLLCAVQVVMAIVLVVLGRREFNAWLVMLAGAELVVAALTLLLGFMKE